MHPTLTETQQEHVFSFVFHASMWWRIGYGVLRIILGGALLRVIGTPFSELLYALMSHEVAGDPDDILFQFAYRLLDTHSYEVTFFVAFYFIFWGVLDIFLSISLLRHKLWAFPVSFILITFFLAYSLFRFAHTHSNVLLCTILVDLAIMYLIYREYRILRPIHTQHTNVSPTLP